MSKVTMPEPSAEITSMNNVTVFDLTAHGKRSGLSVGEKFITTTQAEAYADARVREALEKAESIVRSNADACASLAVRVMLHSNADAIHSLIPPLPGPVEP